jgi:proteasome lid subunit RPN8/RPN11
MDPSDLLPFKDVLGMLIGHQEGESEIKDVIIEDAVPVSHGGSIEVAFATEDYITFSAIDEKYAQKDWFTVGWYHSHPGLDIFFSTTDIRNQLGWQNANPSAVGIVFDHSYLDLPGDLGFRTFRLDDPSKGATSKYYEVETIVEAPKDLDFYFKIIDLINSIHSKEPPVMEVNETPMLFTGIDLPRDDELRATKPELDLESMLSNLQNGFNAVINSSIKPLLTQFNRWSQDVIGEIVKNNILLKNDLDLIKSNLNSGIKKIQTDFKLELTNKFNEIDFFIDDKLEGFDKDFATVKERTNTIKEDLLKQLDDLFNSASRKLEDNIYNIYNSQKESLSETKTILSDNRQVIESFKEKFNQFEEKLEAELNSLFLNLNF